MPHAIDWPRCISIDMLPLKHAPQLDLRGRWQAAVAAFIKLDTRRDFQKLVNEEPAVMMAIYDALVNDEKYATMSSNQFEDELRNYANKTDKLSQAITLAIKGRAGKTVANVLLPILMTPTANEITEFAAYKEYQEQYKQVVALVALHAIIHDKRLAALKELSEATESEFKKNVQKLPKFPNITAADSAQVDAWKEQFAERLYEEAKIIAKASSPLTAVEARYRASGIEHLNLIVDRYKRCSVTTATPVAAATAQNAQAASNNVQAAADDDHVVVTPRLFTLR